MTVAWNGHGTKERWQDARREAIRKASVHNARREFCGFGRALFGSMAVLTGVVVLVVWCGVKFWHW